MRTWRDDCPSGVTDLIHIKAIQYNAKSVYPYRRLPVQPLYVCVCVCVLWYYIGMDSGAAWQRYGRLHALVEQSPSSSVEIAT